MINQSSLKVLSRWISPLAALGTKNNKNGNFKGHVSPRALQLHDDTEERQELHLGGCACGCFLRILDTEKAKQQTRAPSRKNLGAKPREQATPQNDTEMEGLSLPPPFPFSRRTLLFYNLPSFPRLSQAARPALRVGAVLAAAVMRAPDAPPSRRGRGRARRGPAPPDASAGGGAPLPSAARLSRRPAYGHQNQPPPGPRGFGFLPGGYGL